MPVLRRALEAKKDALISINTASSKMKNGAAAAHAGIGALLPLLAVGTFGPKDFALLLLLAAVEHALGAVDDALQRILAPPPKRRDCDGGARAPNHHLTAAGC